jgi:hypothetical protein
MALRIQGEYFYGDSQADIPAVLADYSADSYPAERFRVAVCTCGGTVFRLLLDEDAGVALRTCVVCSNQHAMGDSEAYLEDADPEARECLCGADTFEITAGVALYAGSEDVKWLYIGCRCPACGLIGCYGDWKNEFGGYEELLRRV